MISRPSFFMAVVTQVSTPNGEPQLTVGGSLSVRLPSEANWHVQASLLIASAARQTAVLFFRRA